MYSYSKYSLAESIAKVGIRHGDVVSLQVSAGRLGMPEGASSFPEIANLIIDGFLEALGESGTLIVPTYTYSIGRGDDFEVETTPSAIGEFTEIFRSRVGIIRSRDPMLSNAGTGPKAEAILRNLSQSCCGLGSVFDKLRQCNAKICTLGVGLYYATFVQHIEEMAAVPFRFHKTFNGKVIEKAVESRESWTYFAAPFLSNCNPNPLALERLAKSAGIVRIAEVGRGQLFCVDADTYFNFGIRELTQSPWLTAEGPPCDKKLMLRHMSR